LSKKETHFLQLLEAHKGILYKICCIYQDNQQDQEDLQQEIILQLWQSYDSFRGESQFSSWMYRVALNTAIVFFKKKNRRPDQTSLPANMDPPEETANRTEKEEQLTFFYKAIRHLDKVEKALIFLYMEDQTAGEIANALGLSSVNIRVRLNRVKTKLKQIIKSMGYEY